MSEQCVLCGHCIQNDWVNRATNQHRILHWAWTFIHWSYLDDSKGCSYGQLVIDSFITTTHPLMHHISCRVLWQNIKSPRWLSPTTAQIWHPATSGFSQNCNHLWNGGDFRSSMRFRKIWWGSWWWLRELCEVLRCLLWGDWGIIVLCTVFLYLVSSSISVSTFHITWLDTFWTHIVY